MTKEDWLKFVGGEHMWNDSLYCSCHPDNPVKSYCQTHAEMGIYLPAVEYRQLTGSLCAWCIRQLGRG